MFIYLNINGSINEEKWFVLFLLNAACLMGYLYILKRKCRKVTELIVLRHFLCRSSILNMSLMV